MGGTPLDAGTIFNLLKLGLIAPGPAGYRFTPSPEELAHRPSPQAKYGPWEFSKVGPYTNYDSVVTSDGKILNWGGNKYGWEQAL